jgi:hypothetical protein
VSTSTLSGYRNIRGIQEAHWGTRHPSYACLPSANAYATVVYTVRAAATSGLPDGKQCARGAGP